MRDQPPECDEEVPESDTTQEEEKKELPEWLQVSAPTEEERAELDKKLSELQLVSQQEIRKTGSKKVSRPAYSAGKRDGRRGLQDKLALMRKQAEHLVECNSKIDRTIESISSVPHPPAKKPQKTSTRNPTHSNPDSSGRRVRCGLFIHLSILSIDHERI